MVTLDSLLISHMTFLNLFFWALFFPLCMIGMILDLVFMKWIWTAFLAPDCYGFIFLLILVSMCIEDKDPIVWPMPFLYMYMVWNYNQVTTDFFFSYISSNWQIVMYYLVGYLVTGLIWSAIKLAIFVKSDKYSKTFFIKHDPVTHEAINGNKDAEMIVRENLPRIQGWVIYWPLSIFNYLTYDMITYILNLLFKNFMKKVYIYVVNKALNLPTVDENEKNENANAKPVRSNSPSRNNK